MTDTNERTVTIGGEPYELLEPEAFNLAEAKVFADMCGYEIEATILLPGFDQEQIGKVVERLRSSLYVQAMMVTAYRRKNSEASVEDAVALVERENRLDSLVSVLGLKPQAEEVAADPPPSETSGGNVRPLVSASPSGDASDESSERQATTPVNTGTEG